jgi:hypothetical protein
MIILPEEVGANEKVTVILRAMMHMTFVTSSTKEGLEDLAKKVYLSRPPQKVCPTDCNHEDMNLLVYVHFSCCCACARLSCARGCMQGKFF